MTRLLAVLLFLAPVSSAMSHEATPTATQPLGWPYGFECCSIADCWQELSSAIKETPGGYLVVGTGEVIPYSDRRVKRSRDEFYYRCAAAGNPTLSRSICLYTPDRGY